MFRLKTLLFGPQNRIARRLIVLVIAFSSLITLLISAVQLAFEYAELRGNMERTLERVAIFVPSLSGSVWNFDEVQIGLTLDALKQLPTVDKVIVTTTDDGTRWSAGQGLSPHVVTRTYSLRQRVRGTETEIGSLTVVASLDVIYHQLAGSALRIILSNGMKTFLVAMFMVFLLRRLVTARLEKLAHRVRELRPKSFPLANAQDAQPVMPSDLDELDALRWTLDGTTEDIRRAEESLRQINADLERRVQERTTELSESLKQLRVAQNQLVQTEKMAALGGLVAGVAHEINTPLGVGVTAASHLAMKVRGLAERLASGALSRADMTSFIANATDSSEMVLSNLQRAAELIRSFKQVAVDQSSGQRRHFRLKTYLEEVLLSLSPQLRRTRHEISIDCPSDLELYGHPGSFAQIITNLVMNSLLHGFDGIAAGHIAIRVLVQPQGLLLQYSDDGRGIAPEHLAHIFEPFYTTRRGQGGSGLGLHIVYNIVTQGLLGSIACSSEPGQGARFDIHMPHEAATTVDDPAAKAPAVSDAGP